MNKLNTPVAQIIICFFIFISTIHAQHDVILKTSGEEMVGTVVQMNQNDLLFTYQNETIKYTVSKSDIVKITFTSGRVEFFNKPKADTKQNLENHHNKVAILPFGYLKDQETSNAEMQKNIQSETYTIFNKKAHNLSFQAPKTTNLLLSKAGIVNNNIDGYTMGEIANILGVEYIIQGMVSIEKTSVTSTRNTQSTTSPKKNKAYIDKHGHIIGDIWSSNKGRTNSYSYSKQTQNYSTNITMNIYTDNGRNIYNKNHQSFWQTEDAYKITLDYLARRTPLFKK
ncbi:hypothetical protein F6U93_05590 [Tamlana haliotis]|uniref:Uncharacterized protein n=1 Tax=Pseudotamlana haliotis TaxID=2614804 RepID=A0A6N6MKK6_9FLAO|nr:hypothetical protein [Tamlana haliotis]KAB1068785.1 hypothetical protein F6U93_05590 [Tamlana haliotis]